MAKAKEKHLFTEDTEVSPARSAAEITALLIQAGAQSISTNFKDNEIESLSFVLPRGAGSIPYRLPVRIDPVFAVFQARRKKGNPYGYKTPQCQNADRDKAKRVAWRQMYWWLKAQLAVIDLGMVETAEVLLPYMLGRDGNTFYDTHKAKLLAAPVETE